MSDSYINNRIECKRQKTEKDYSIKITESILNLYVSGKNNSDFIFPIITRVSSPQLVFNIIKEKRRIYNKKLKEIADLCSISVNLTGYVARHTWATIAKQKSIPIAVISEGM